MTQNFKETDQAQHHSQEDHSLGSMIQDYHTLCFHMNWIPEYTLDWSVVQGFCILCDDCCIGNQFLRSCPPIRIYTTQNIERGLGFAADNFCSDEANVSVNMEAKQVLYFIFLSCDYLYMHCYNRLYCHICSSGTAKILVQMTTKSLSLL